MSNCIRATKSARLPIVFFIAALLTACVEYRPIEQSIQGTAPHYEVAVGDKVKVITEDATSLEFKVVEVTDTSIIGDSVEVQFQDIRLLQVKEGERETAVALTGYFSLGAMILLAVVGFAVAL